MKGLAFSVSLLALSFVAQANDSLITVFEAKEIRTSLSPEARDTRTPKATTCRLIREIVNIDGESFVSFYVETDTNLRFVFDELIVPTASLPLENEVIRYSDPLSSSTGSTAAQKIAYKNGKLRLQMNKREGRSAGFFLYHLGELTIDPELNQPEKLRIRLVRFHGNSHPETIVKLKCEF